jgi:hypothetical protein
VSERVISKLKIVEPIAIKIQNPNPHYTIGENWYRIPSAPHHLLSANSTELEPETN